MPKSKRAKVVHLSKVEKKTKEHSQKLFASVQECAERFQYCFVFAVNNMRNNYLKDVRQQLPHSRLFFGKTKLLARALGTTPEDETLPNIRHLTPHLSGSVGLLFTSQPPIEITDFFTSYIQTDFARAGIQAPREFTIPEGIVYSRGGEVPQDDDVAVAHSLDPVLKRWGMPTRLVKGKVMLDNPYTVCREGQTLDANQTAVLKMFGVAVAEFRVKLLAYYDKQEEKVELLEDDAMGG
ncbi:MAG: mRNA turnover and ribosome assembly protein [Chrysothrix sp. TS-e1954]|nr:MAG: mRNA turnover and ribosome assembly protein [Chrysothrix sp. TS-e1954]